MSNNKKKVVGIKILMILVGILVVAGISVAIIFTLRSYTDASDLDETDTVAYTEDTTTAEDTTELSPIDISVPETTTTEAETETETETETESETEEETEPVSSEPRGGIVWVGDSRYVGMSYHAVDGDVFFSQVGVGYKFMLEHYDEIVAACQNASALVLGLGVNCTGDPGAPGNYGGLINKIAEEVPCTVIVQLLGTTNEEQMVNSGYANPIYNSSIEAFNQFLIAAFINTDIKLINANEFIQTNGVPFSDGLHYSTEGYIRIYEYLRGQVLALL